MRWVWISQKCDVIWIQHFFSFPVMLWIISAMIFNTEITLPWKLLCDICWPTFFINIRSSFTLVWTWSALWHTVYYRLKGHECIIKQWEVIYTIRKKKIGLLFCVFCLFYFCSDTAYWKHASFLLAHSSSRFILACFRKCLLRIWWYWVISR